jgi:hypothetical protein
MRNARRSEFAKCAKFAADPTVRPWDSGGSCSPGAATAWRCHPMALPGTSWHYRTEPSFPNSEETPVGYRILGTASEAGGRAFESRPGHHLISRGYRTSPLSTDPQLYRTTPNQFDLRHRRRSRRSETRARGASLDWGTRVSTPCRSPPAPLSCRALRGERHPRRPIVIAVAMNGCTGSGET